ncbi:unnamed protein product [Dovyalis caffra]|uniref:Uncharacterized protein n=1 Tax=Dovyalis caffra TaxID=77055 RepID=A0AAV1RX13_9ROSI|nr:unnamed protein product [Dovyalis caffra]
MSRREVLRKTFVSNNSRMETPWSCFPKSILPTGLQAGRMDAKVTALGITSFGSWVQDGSGCGEDFVGPHA